MTKITGKKGRIAQIGENARNYIFHKFSIDPDTMKPYIDDPHVVDARKKARRAENPGITFWEIFSTRNKDGEEEFADLSMKRIKRDAALGAHHFDKLGDWIKEKLDKLRKKPDDVFDEADRLDDFWDEPEEEEPVARDDPEPGSDSADRQVRDAAGIASEKVGPERQVTRDDDGNNRGPGPLVAAPRLLQGPESTPEHTNEAKTRGLPGANPVNRRLQGPGQPGSGEEAARKGARKAQTMADEKPRSARRHGRKDAGMEI